MPIGRSQAASPNLRRGVLAPSSDRTYPASRIRQLDDAGDARISYVRAHSDFSVIEGRGRGELRERSIHGGECCSKVLNLAAVGDGCFLVLAGSL